MIRSVTRPIFFTIWVCLALCLFITTQSFSADIGNCLLCHKYPNLSRVNEEGRVRLFFVNENIFANSVHAKVRCQGCHVDIQKIPHDPARPVDCTTECHLEEPSSGEKFSHKRVAQFLSKSVHAKIDSMGKEKKYVEDYPYCKDCHDEPLYRPLSIYKTVRPGISEQALGRCRVCHKRDAFVYRFYNHVTTRLRKSRTPRDIATVCSRCHDNKEYERRHGAPGRAARSYFETFHGKMANHGAEFIPDCLDCHILPGTSVHEMLPKRDPKAPTNEAQKYRICADNPECHPTATRNLGSYDIHPTFNPKEDLPLYLVTVFFYFLTGGTLLPLFGIMFLDSFRRLVAKSHH